jgi:aryl-alcohol dehydrogenase-like predicted oxidoreductase
MKKVILGRTGLSVNACGLGCGGFSRIGIEQGGIGHAREIVRHAYGLGIDFFDTATAYGTQEAVSDGLNGIPRRNFVLSTKFPLFEMDVEDDWRNGCEKRFSETLDESLRILKTDYIDIYHLHGVTPEDYPDARDILVPLMLKAKDAGKIRFLGITERFVFDTSHKMLQRAILENLFDVVMVGYNMLNPSAAKSVLPLAKEKNVAVLNMFAVRRALADKAFLKENIEKILAQGQGGADLKADPDALDFLKDAAASTMEAAYRFCAHTEGIHVVLTGTGNAAHLEENLCAMEKPPLPEKTLRTLFELFGAVDCVNGQ